MGKRKNQREKDLFRTGSELIIDILAHFFTFQNGDIVCSRQNSVKKWITIHTNLESLDMKHKTIILNHNKS